MSGYHECDHICPTCRQSFETTFAAERFCSDECYTAWFGHPRPSRILTGAGPEPDMSAHCERCAAGGWPPLGDDTHVRDGF